MNKIMPTGFIAVAFCGAATVAMTLRNPTIVQSGASAQRLPDSVGG